MFRRNQRGGVRTPVYMDPELIGALEQLAPDDSMPPYYFVRAVLFGTGALKALRSSTEVYGLVLAGYQGLHFGDDGSYTGMVASELALSSDGVRRLEGIVNEAVRSRNPAYCADFVRGIAVDEAAVKLDVEIKRDMGVDYPAEVFWSNGSLVSYA